MLYKIRYNPMHTIYGALPVPKCQCPLSSCMINYMGYTRYLNLVAHRYTSLYCTSPRCRILQYLRTLIPLSGSLWNDHPALVVNMVWDWQVSRAGPMPVYLASCSLLYCLLRFSVSLLSFYELVLWGLGLPNYRG